MHSLTIGMMQTAAEQTPERIWGYRSLGEMILNRTDLSFNFGRGMVEAYDMGIELGGKFNPQGSAYYSLAATNGTITVAKSDKIKKYSVVIGFLPDKWSALEAYVDYENFLLGRSAITGKIFYGMGTKSYAFGLEVFYRMNRKFVTITGADITPAGASLFTWFEMTQGLRGVLRVDGADNDLKTSNAGYREVDATVGLDITAIPEVHIIPNVVYVKQMEKGNSPVIGDFIAGRLTMAVYFP